MSITAERPPATETTTTIVTRLRDRAADDPAGVALREKHSGIWLEYTWADYWESVLDVAHGLLALGVAEGDRVSIQSENRPEWVFTDFATIAIRAITNGLYPTNPAAEVRYLLKDSGTKILIAEDQEQVDKALEVKGDLPALERIIYIEARGVRTYDDALLLSWEDFLALGREHRAANGGAVEQRMVDASPDDTAVLIYTSGTTGPPKGAMLSLGNIGFVARTASGAEGLIDPPAGPHDVYLSYLPLSHVYERLFTCWIAIMAGYQVHFAESIETVQADLREVQPTIFPSVPRILEKINAAVAIRMASASPVKRTNYRLWSRVAGWIGDTLVRTGGRHTTATRLAYGAGWLFLYRALKDRIGLRKCRVAVSAAAPIAPEILKWFMGIGVPMVEAYGQTEGAALATSNRRGRVKLGTVGEPMPGLEVLIDERTGEILVRHPGVFKGYWNNPEATRETVDEEGWLHTGDVGEWVDGTHVKIVDRLKDIIITAGGKNISPSEIENSLKTSPFVREAVVIGDRRKFLTALIGIELDSVADWAQRRKIPFTTYRDLTDKEEVQRLIQQVVDETNEKFARVEQIKQFRLIPKELDHEEGELTATQKVKRRAIEQEFADLIDRMYGSARAGAA
jgi:long-chain acyl-CoA synthetase